MSNPFVGVLLDASRNRDNKLEYTNINGTVVYRVGGFGTRWDINKARPTGCNTMQFLHNVAKAKAIMKERGLTVPGVFTSQPKPKKAKGKRK